MPPLTFFQPGAQPNDASQACPICGRGVPASPRYPNYVCSACFVEAADEDGHLLDFHNISMTGGFEAVYRATKERRNSHICYIRGIQCYANEARFGGIVIQPIRDNS